MDVLTVAGEKAQDELSVVLTVLVDELYLLTVSLVVGALQTVAPEMMVVVVPQISVAETAELLVDDLTVV